MKFLGGIIFALIRIHNCIVTKHKVISVNSRKKLKKCTSRWFNYRKQTTGKKSTDRGFLCTQTNTKSGRFFVLGLAFFKKIVAVFDNRLGKSGNRELNNLQLDLFSLFQLDTIIKIKMATALLKNLASLEKSSISSNNCPTQTQFLQEISINESLYGQSNTEKALHLQWSITAFKIFEDFISSPPDRHFTAMEKLRKTISILNNSNNLEKHSFVTGHKFGQADVLFYYLFSKVLPQTAPVDRVEVFGKYLLRWYSACQVFCEGKTVIFKRNLQTEN